MVLSNPITSLKQSSFFQVDPERELGGGSNLSVAQGGNLNNSSKGELFRDDRLKYEDTGGPRYSRF